MPAREPSLFRSPRTTGELRSFVAHFGARCARGTTRCSLENVVLRAVETSRRDPALARMLPVFLWRVRDSLDLAELATKATLRGYGPVLGYFLDVASKVSSTRTFQPAVRALRRQARTDSPVFLFLKTEKYPYEAMAARERTPPDARRWGLLTGVPLDSFSSYFAKVAAL
jgi:hypothetical protein